MTTNSNEPGTSKGAQPSKEQLQGSRKQQELPGKDGKPRPDEAQQQPRREEGKSLPKPGEEKLQTRPADSAAPINSQSLSSEGSGQQKSGKPSENEPRKGAQ